MNKNVHPIAATAIVLICIFAVAFWLWARGEAKEYGGPAGLTVDPDGHLYIQLRNQLLEHDPNGRFIARHDLSALQVDAFMGGTGFFSNGDILLRRGPDTRSLADTFRAYQRKTNTESLVPDAPDTGLFRCNLDTGACRVFGPSAIDFKSAFSVYIDRRTDDVYISDSSRHLVRKYSAEGIEVAEPAQGFKFPNQLMLHDGMLLVADTNHLQIRAVSFETDGFGSEHFEADVVPEQAQMNDEHWPSHFVRVGDEWWVNNMMTGMNYGGIYAFDDRWEYQRMIVLPGDPDPIAMTLFNGEVLISDWYGDRVHRVSTTGDVLGDFESEGLQTLLAEFETEREMYMVLGWIVAALSLVFVAILVIKGTDWKGRKPQPEEPPASDLREPLTLEPEPEHVKKLKSHARIALLIMVPLAIGVPAVMFQYMFEEPKLMINAGLAILGILVFVVAMRWAMNMLISTSIHFEGDHVTLTNHAGKAVRSPLDKVFFCDTMVYSDNISVSLGQHNAPVYDREKALAVLSQRLPSSQRLSQWQMTKMMLAERHPGTVIAFFGVGLGIAAFVYFELM